MNYEYSCVTSVPIVFVVRYRTSTGRYIVPARYPYMVQTFQERCAISGYIYLALQRSALKTDLPYGTPLWLMIFCPLALRCLYCTTCGTIHTICSGSVDRFQRGRDRLTVGPKRGGWRRVRSCGMRPTLDKGKTKTDSYHTYYTWCAVSANRRALFPPLAR